MVKADKIGIEIFPNNLVIIVNQFLQRRETH